MSDLVSELQTLIATERAKHGIAHFIDYQCACGADVEPGKLVDHIEVAVAERVASAFQQVGFQRETVNAHGEPVGFENLPLQNTAEGAARLRASGWVPVWLFVSDLKETP